MTAEHIVRVLGGRWTGRSGIARCPVHEDRSPSLSVSERDGRVLVHCHAGCPQPDVIAALRARAVAGAGPYPAIARGQDAARARVRGSPAHPPSGGILRQRCNADFRVGAGGAITRRPRAGGTHRNPDGIEG
jgi:hypothetical protein